MSDGRRPREVQVGPYLFTVVADEARLLKEVGDATAHSFGYMNALEQKILINPRQAADMERDTILHEVIHACLIPLGLGEEEEERVVALLSTALLDVFRRNPRLVTYLTASP